MHEDAAFLGALSLDGHVVKVEGMLPALIVAKGLGFKQVFLPYDRLLPIEMLEGIECAVVHHLKLSKTVEFYLTVTIISK
ncbi:magnesium chelatase domain-containing protein [Alkalihalobacillus deserti]|uniref:magnesium chelatase domain-containing protein n=1 Tax=Alkalihalobacillus deserti TaxID=2879466 RepID=UPI001D144269|nr:magnesium chelatase domain-containing protein [Alkalihalobacillus deserti]